MPLARLLLQYQLLYWLLTRLQKGQGEVAGLLSCRHAWLTDPVASTSRKLLQHTLPDRASTPGHARAAGSCILRALVLISAITAPGKAKAAGTVTILWGTCVHMTGSSTHQAGQLGTNALAGAGLSQTQAAAEICLSAGAWRGLSQQAEQESGQGQQALRLQEEEYGQAQALVGANCTSARYHQPAQSHMAKQWVRSEPASSADAPLNTARSHQALTP